MRKTIFNIFIILIAQNHLRTTYAQNIRCQKVDFNRQTSVVNEFGECDGVIPPNILKINSYSATTITPFRPSSEFHLSAVDGLSCLLSTSTFTLDIFSEIRTAIFLNSNIAGAWVKVQIYDNDGDEIDVIAHSEESTGWIAYYGKVNRTIENAHVEISTNINANSIMAMEYLFVLNSELPDDECADEETEPIITDPTDDYPTEEPTVEPTEEPTDDPTNEPTDDPTNEPTDDPTNEPTDDPTNEPTDDPTNEPTDDPTNEPTDITVPSTEEPITTDVFTDETENDNTTTTTPESARQSRSAATNVWMGLSILFLATTVISLAGFYYFIWIYRKLIRSMIPVTTSSGNDEMVNTLPRLQVKSSVIDGDSVIVGIDKFR